MHRFVAACPQPRKAGGGHLPRAEGQDRIPRGRSAWAFEGSVLCCVRGSGFGLKGFGWRCRKMATPDVCCEAQVSDRHCEGYCNSPLAEAQSTSGSAETVAAKFECELASCSNESHCKPREERPSVKVLGSSSPSNACFISGCSTRLSLLERLFV